MKTLLFLGVLCLGLFAVPAQAYELKFGPSASLMEFRPGLPNPFALSPGVGVQGGFDFKLWSLEAAFFGNALALLGHGPSGAEASIAVFGCYRAIGICAGPLVVLGGPSGGLFGGFTWKKSVGIVFSLSGDALSFLNFGTTTP